MVNWFDRLLSSHPREGHRNNDRIGWLREEETLLPHNRNEQSDASVPPAEVYKVCLRLRHLIQECIPCEMEEAIVTRAHSPIITDKVIKAAKEAAGKDYRGCVVFCLLVNKGWFKHEAATELWDADLHSLRAAACGVIAKNIIESEEDQKYLLHSLLLRKYSYISDGQPTHPINVIEKAVDLHDVRVIASSGYQKCITYLWKGWLVQDEDDGTVFVEYKHKANQSLFVHMDPDRMRAPVYQNAAQLILSLVYLGLYTAAVNSMNPNGTFDSTEIVLYIWTLGLVCDEITKVYKAGYQILGLWNGFNAILFTFLTISFVFRCIGLGHEGHSVDRLHFSQLSYNLLAFVAPMFWVRLLLYMDAFRFFGAMLVVLKVMMKESAIFFSLLAIVNIGFLQAFIGLDLADDNVADDVWFIIHSMMKVMLLSPEFDGFEKFGPPFGLILQYTFTFIVQILLINILIALWNAAYDDVYGDADNEYLALLAEKTTQFIRAPDENVYIAPFNLVEMIVVVLFEWWVPRKTYEVINDAVMGVIYSPLLFIAAYLEKRKAIEIRRNRARGEEDDDIEEEWEQMNNQIDFESDGWAKICDSVKPNLDEEPAVVEVKKLRSEIDELRTILGDISKAVTLAAQRSSKRGGKEKQKGDSCSSESD